MTRIRKHSAAARVYWETANRTDRATTYKKKPWTQRFRFIVWLKQVTDHFQKSLALTCFHPVLLWLDWWVWRPQTVGSSDIISSLWVSGEQDMSILTDHLVDFTYWNSTKLHMLIEAQMFKYVEISIFNSLSSFLNFFDTQMSEFVYASSYSPIKFVFKPLLHFDCTHHKYKWGPWTFLSF